MTSQRNLFMGLDFIKIGFSVPWITLVFNMALCKGTIGIWIYEDYVIKNEVGYYMK